MFFHCYAFIDDIAFIFYAAIRRRYATPRFYERGNTAQSMNKYEGTARLVNVNR